MKSNKIADRCLIAQRGASHGVFASLREEEAQRL